MSIRLFNLQDVPDDEADEIRYLLDRNNINYYETPSGNWGFSMAAIWVKDEKQIIEAYELIKAYQEERVIKARKEYSESRKESLYFRYKKNKSEYTFYFIVLVIVMCMLFLGVRHPM